MTGGTNRPFSAQGHSVYALLRLHFDDELTQRYVTLHTKLYIKIIYTTAREPQVLTLALGRVEKHLHHHHHDYYYNYKRYLSMTRRVCEAVAWSR